MNKLRSDSAFCQLTPEQTDVLEEWLFEERLGYPQVVEKLKAEFGLETSLTGVRRFYKRLDLERLALSLMDAVEMSGLVTEALKSGTIKPGMMLLANKCAFELMRQPEPPIRKVTALLRAITSAEAHTMKQTIYEKEQAERKEAERVRKVEEEWRRAGREIEREDEELRQKRAVRKKVKQEAEANLQPKTEGKASSDQLDVKTNPHTPHPNPLPVEGRGGNSASVIGGLVARGSTLVNSTSEEAEEEKAVGRADSSVAKDAGGVWQPSVVENAEDHTEEAAENRLTPLNAA